MHNVPPDARLEIKFVADEFQAKRIERWLNLNGAGFYRPYPDRWVNNVYFDTYNYYAYNENLSGSSYRTKVRYRWYGCSPHPNKGVLELKCKRNYFGWKMRFPIDQRPGDTGSSWKEIIHSLKTQISSKGKNWLAANPHTVIINRYYRQYFVTSDDKIRATIDSEQTFYDQRYKPYPNMRNKANIPAYLVLEFKFDRKDRSLANRIMQGLPLRVSRNSKYVFGIRSIQGF